ncbi:twin-arginine translocase TatA/TatE family subunit [Halopseudomonas phragmitis]|uniref:Sec-independent protein translocase protein TatA n=2 Tax=Pseudomonadaceae TaxID=135621 RepID=A0A1V0B296_9GAMM|nr:MULTISPECIES: twin-arginine translocase TatA/TatE family subunit [Pseudomonadaceae]AQZ93904.1 Sec-independent protein translocase TatA [Halopseudomonas phragmitis]RHW20493.1 twin-arginine translocase TatA/TatE family subunit [Pseudomonas jilinensis]
MGFGGISLWQLLIILLIVILLFGTKRLKGIGSDLGEAIKGFRKSVNQDEDKPANDSIEKKDADTIDVTAEKKQDSQSKD